MFNEWKDMLSLLFFSFPAKAGNTHYLKLLLQPSNVCGLLLAQIKQACAIAHMREGVLKLFF